MLPDGTKLPEDCLNLFKGMLNKDMEARFTVKECLNHPFLKDPSSPMSLHKLARVHKHAINFGKITLGKVINKSNVNVLLKRHKE